MGWEFGDTPASRRHVLLSLQESTTLSVAIILLLFFHSTFQSCYMDLSENSSRDWGQKPQNITAALLKADAVWNVKPFYMDTQDQFILPWILLSITPHHLIFKYMLKFPQIIVGYYGEIKIPTVNYPRKLIESTWINTMTFQNKIYCTISYTLLLRYWNRNLIWQRRSVKQYFRRFLFWRFSHY